MSAGPSAPADDELFADDDEQDTLGVDSSGMVAAGQSDLNLLAAGQITKEEFLERAVDQATRHLDGAVDVGKIEMIRELLLAQLEQDPHLSALAAQATAH